MVGVGAGVAVILMALRVGRMGVSEGGGTVVEG